MLYQLKDRTPIVGKDVYIAPGAHIIGSVELADQVSVWFNAVLRGDTDWLRIGRGSNIQDNAVLHTDQGIELVIGENVTVGHQVMLHSCEIGDNSLVGIGAIILNGAKIGKNCVIGAGTLIPERKVIPDNSLVIGTPGKIVRTVPEDMLEKLKAGSGHYIHNAQHFSQHLRPLDTTPTNS